MKTKPNLKFLTTSQLVHLTTPRLLRILKSARAVECSILKHYGHRCCEVCNEFIGSQKEWEEDVLKYSRPVTDYKNKIKELLSIREHVVRK